MKYLAQTLVLTLLAGCTEYHEFPQPDPIFNITEAAGREAPTPRDESVKWPEAGPSDEVGKVVSALNVCYAAKSKAKARYGCVYGWVETSYQMTNESGTCSNGEQYLLFNTTSQPVSNSVRFEVDRKQCIPDAGCGWVFRHYIQCSCNNSPCYVTN